MEVIQFLFFWQKFSNMKFLAFALLLSLLHSSIYLSQKCFSYYRRFTGKSV